MNGACGDRRSSFLVPMHWDCLSAVVALDRRPRANQALTVTFLMPVCGVISWAVLLRESITLPMVGDTALIFVGLDLVLALSRPKQATAD